MLLRNTINKMSQEDAFIQTRNRDDLFKLSSPIPQSTHSGQYSERSKEVIIDDDDAFDSKSDERRGPEIFRRDEFDEEEFHRPQPSATENLDFKDILNNPDLIELLKKRSVPKSPTVDYSSDEMVQKRVLKLINKSCDVDYEKEHDKVKEAVTEAFMIKYQNLKIHYPDMAETIKFPEGKQLNFIHKHYHGIIKSIYVSMNLGQTQLCYVLCLMVLEFVCVKALGLPMAGFTKMELKRMYKYESMMIELGESWYSSGEGGEPQPIEWRIATSFIWNVVIFLGIKILSNYLESENLVETIRDIVDKLFESNVSKDDIESGDAKKMHSEGEELLSGLSGGGGFESLINMVTNIGGGMTRNMENRQRKKGPVKRNRFVFE